MNRREALAGGFGGLVAAVLGRKITATTEPAQAVTSGYAQTLAPGTYTAILPTVRATSGSPITIQLNANFADIRKAIGTP